MEPEDKAADLVADMRSTGLNHIAFDVGPAIEAENLDGMKGFLSELNRQVSIRAMYDGQKINFYFGGSLFGLCFFGASALRFPPPVELSRWFG